ncbi:MAG TPA: beta-ketoacyl-[acyl-carrier-protein] synthase family protein [Noviherbaspirillum sp.]|uniref:beta-ketoacyl-[acyl-carrier-protein] synthase family protein n=1 Tax=Noviherbaspirillum sp. TaxID=1926288 RepID=UPI002B49AF96|nr:beta-ketoacyl-[acyl-carrier-protein] synthase family protein [Noviherbaspirillum sp.]HJV87433.1 beta-ketoacyl-[acyl-carrier-protein] synthase family protein [Noviherbaspirillum sp.]
MNGPERVVITGIGAVSALGAGIEPLFAGALAGESGIRPWPGPDSRWVAATIPEEMASRSMPGLPTNVDRHVGFATLAVREALANAQLGELSAVQSERFGVYWGTGVGSAATTENSYARLHAGQRIGPMTVLLAMQNAALAQIALEFGLRGPQLSVSQACASAATAIGEAMLALRWGRADRIIVGGSEAPVVPGQMQAWDALRVLARRDENAPEKSCRPFDRKRTGLALGEGAAAFVLERESVALARGAHIHAELCGYGNAGDASHYARPDADGQRRAMALAVRDGEVALAEIGYINAHATATTVGDQIEAAAIREFFSGSGAAPAVSSTKGVHGHTLGAAGALELAITVLALERGTLPPTAHLDEPGVDGIELLHGQAKHMDIDVALSNTFAFGGSNVSLAIRRHRAA